MTADAYWSTGTTDRRSEQDPAAASHERSEPPALQTRPEAPQTGHAGTGSHETAQSDPQKVETLLHSLIDRIEQSDRRYGDALDDLHSRLEHISHNAGAAPESVEPETAQTPAHENSLAAALAERLPEAAAPQPAQAPGLALGDIEHRLDDFAAPARADQEPAVLREPDPAFAPASPSGLDDRFMDISERLDQPLSAGAPAHETDAFGPQTDALSHPLDTAFEPSEPSEPVEPSDALTSIESRLGLFAEQLGHAEQQFGRLESIEGHLLRLTELVHDSRAQIEDVAQKTAQETVRLFASEHDTTLAASRLDAIQSELQALGDRARQMDDRTIDTLEAMNETLKSLASRIGIGDAASLEDAPSAAPTVAVAPDAPPEPFADPDPYAAERPLPPGPEYAEVRITPAPEAPAPAAQPAMDPVPGPQDPVSRSLGVDIPDYQPIAGRGMQASYESGGMPAPESPMPAAAPAAMAPPASARGLGSEDDFIASARRAAQAAAAHAPPQPESKSILSRFKREKQPARAVRSAPIQEDGKKSRPILVFAAIFLLIVSAALLYSRLKSKAARPVAETPQHSIPAPSAPRPSATGGQSSVHPGPQRGGTSPAPFDAAGAAPPPKKRSLVTTAPSGADRIAPSRPAEIVPQQGYRDADAAPARRPETTVPKGRTAPRSATTARPAPLLATPIPGLTLEVSEAPPARGRRMARTSRPETGLTEKPGAARQAHQAIPLPPAALGPLSLRTAAARGNPAAQFEIANRFAEGKGVDVNYVAAARWYKRAAAQGLAPAQYRLAAFYERGRGVEQDAGRARVWYGRAAEQGNVKAMHNLAVMQTSDEEKGPDYATAGQWFERAARLGLSDSQYNLGVLYQNGLGVRKNLAEAYKWFSLAAKGGDREAEKRRKLMKLQVLPATLKEVEAKVAKWKAQPVKKAANAVTSPKGGWQNAKQTGNAVTARVQTLLNKLGYEAGTPDGKMGPRTQAAIRTFQKRSGLAVTGEVDDTLVDRLESLAS